MIAFLLIIALILFFTWILICYALVKFIASIIGRLTATKWVTGKTVVIVTSIVIALLPFFYLLFSTGAQNYTTAYIQPQAAGYKLTVKGKRMLMVHDPVSALLNHTYEDSASFIIPRQGIIPHNEIQVLNKDYKFTGTIVIDEQKMKIQLFYDNLHKEPCDWNGTYHLKLR
jgi:Mg2+/Co2+ transporter CorB